MFCFLELQTGEENVESGTYLDFLNRFGTAEPVNVIDFLPPDEISFLFSSFLQVFDFSYFVCYLDSVLSL